MIDAGAANLNNLLGISGGVSFFTYFPTTPSLIVLSLFFLDNILLVALTRITKN